MDFYKYLDQWGAFKKSCNNPLFREMRGMIKTREDWWNMQLHLSEASQDAFTFRTVHLEREWLKKDRPYYNCYPAILPMLVKLDLDIQCSLVQNITIQPLELRLPKGGLSDIFSWDNGKQQIRSILFGIQDVPLENQSEHMGKGLVIAFDIGETDPSGYPIYSMKFFPFREEMTVNEACQLFPDHISAIEGTVIPKDVVTNTIKLCCCVALIEHDSELLEPDILSVDKPKWEEADVQKRLQLMARAHRRGKNGWNLGESVECIPHYRRPHPALVRYGKGRTMARIVMRRGSIVHKTKVKEIPTGFEANDS
jgi:hypothetical protein